MEERRDEDHHLAEAARDGDAEAFRVLVTRYQRLVSSVAWRYGVRRDDMEDLVSDVFLKLYKNLDQYRPEHPFSTWLYRLAVNQVVDHTRRTRRQAGSTELSEHIPDPALSANAHLLEDERMRLLREALQALQPRYREALSLVYVEGLKVEEAARALSVPEGTIKTRLMRGRDALRKQLLGRYPRYFEA